MKAVTALTVSPARKSDISYVSVTNNITSLGCFATIAVKLHYSVISDAAPFMGHTGFQSFQSDLDVRTGNPWGAHS